MTDLLYILGTFAACVLTVAVLTLPGLLLFVP